MRYTAYPTVESIAVESGAFLSVRLLVRNGDASAVEEQAFDRFGAWQGCDIASQRDE